MKSVHESYCAPMCEVLALETDVVLCDSLDAGSVDPGTGDNWGTF